MFVAKRRGHYDVSDFVFVAKRRGHYDVTDFVFVAKRRGHNDKSVLSRNKFAIRNQLGPILSQSTSPIPTDSAGFSWMTFIWILQISDVYLIFRYQNIFIVFLYRNPLLAVSFEISKVGS